MLLFGNLIYHEIIVIFKENKNGDEEYIIIDNDSDKANKEGNSKTSETRTNELINEENNFEDSDNLLK